MTIVTMGGTTSSFKKNAVCSCCSSAEPSPHIFTYIEYDDGRPESVRVRYRMLCLAPRKEMRGKALQTIQTSVERWNEIAKTDRVLA